MPDSEIFCSIVYYSLKSLCKKHNERKRNTREKKKGVGVFCPRQRRRKEEGNIEKNYESKDSGENIE